MGRAWFNTCFSTEVGIGYRCSTWNVHLKLSSSVSLLILVGIWWKEWISVHSLEKICFKKGSSKASLFI